LIKSNAGCPANGIIAEGLTNKNGKFLIKTISMVWNTDDMPMNIFAEFLGNGMKTALILSAVTGILILGVLVPLVIMASEN